MASKETNRLLNRIENDDDQVTSGVVSRNLTRLCIVTAVLMFAFMIASIALAASLAYTKTHKDHEISTQYIFPFVNLTTGATLNNTLCLSGDCIQAAARLSRNMDTSVHPCEDFYKYSCGGWEEMTSIPEGLGRWGTFEELSHDNYQFLIRAMTDETKSDSKAVTKAKQVFAACTDTKQIDEDGPEALRHFITLNGGWDEANITENSTWSMNSSLVVEHYYGSSAFFSFDIEPDDYNSSKAVIKVGQSGLTLGIPDYYKNDTGDDFIGLISLIGEVLEGIAINNAYVLAEDIATFERDLADLFLTNTELRNVSALYNPMSLNNFTELIPQVDWVEYFNTIFNMTLGSESHHTFTGDDIVIVETVDYFYDLSLLLEDNDPETLRDYAKWHVIYNAIQYADGDLGIYDLLRKTRFPKASRLGDDRAMDCVEFVENAMPYALARPFVDKYISDNLRMKVNATADAIENAFIDRIMEKEWLDNTTKARCVDKVKAITRQIAYPEFIKDNNALDSFYAELQFDADADYFSIGYSILSFQFKEMLRQYGKPVDKTQWLSAPTEVNAYYTPEFNQFVFLAGILRSPFMVADWPPALLFGAMGVVIGHELTHGFDDQGQQYDKNGDRVKWWTDGSIEQFKKRTQCFVNQYSSYDQQGVKINGNLTLGENIADNGGIHTAFRAYKNLNLNQSLPVEQLSNDGIFFVSFGQVWCSLFTTDYLDGSTKTDPHSPGPIRVQGSLHNSKEFAEVFGCDVPKDQCELW